jgi:hypothetical protein
VTDHDPQPQTEPADALAVVQRDFGTEHADLHQVQSVILREGPRAKKTARYVAVKNRHTGEVHHHALTLETGKKLKGTWELDDKRSISFSDEDGDEIGRLMDFLRRVRGEAAPRPAAGESPMGELLGLLRTLSGDVDGLKVLVRTVREQPEAFKGTAAAITFGRYAQALERLKKILAANAGELELRAVLHEHPWMVGTEYSEPVAADELEGEALLRRTPSGRLEALVARRPLAGFALFDGDAPKVELARALGDAVRLRDMIAPAGEVFLTVVIGLDGDEIQQEALRRLNSHLRGLEVLTYDGVVRRAQHVLDVLRATAKREGA